MNTYVTKLRASLRILSSAYGFKFSKDTLLCGGKHVSFRLHLRWNISFFNKHHVFINDMAYTVSITYRDVSTRIIFCYGISVRCSSGFRVSNQFSSLEHWYSVNFFFYMRLNQICSLKQKLSFLVRCRKISISLISMKCVRLCRF